jgi:hypothetical protein
METNVSPIIFIGLFIYVVPTLIGIFHFTIWPIIGQIGLALLIIGILHTAYLRMKG